MGDISMGLAYLCGGCCCFKDTDPGPEGQGVSHGTKHPRERLVDEEFAARKYHKDKDGRIRYQPTPNSTMRLESGQGLGGGSGSAVMMSSSAADGGSSRIGTG